MADYIINESIAKNGERILEINDYLIHSKYNPSREVETIVNNEYKEGYLHIVFGLGVGYLAKALLEKGLPSNKLIVVDPLLEKLKVDFQLDCVFVDTLDEIEGIISTRLKNYSLKINVIAIPNYKLLFPDIYFSLLQKVEKVQYMNQVAVNTVTHFAEVWQENYVKNSVILDEVASFESLIKAYDCPVVIASAGPSLKKQLPMLKKIQKKVVILCAGSTINALLAEGIEPDYIVSIDGGEANLHHFNDILLQNTSLIFSFSNNYKIQRQLPINKYAFLNYEDEQFGQLLSESLNLNLQHIAGGGSVALFAYSIALNITSGPIAFIGQDFAFTGGQTHSEGHKHSFKLEHSHFADRAKILIEGYYGDEVLTDYPFMSMKKELETLHKIFSDREAIYNCTEGGAKILGIAQDSFENFIKTYVTVNVNKKVQVFEKIDIKSEAIYDWLNKELRNLNKAKTLLKDILIELKLVASKKMFTAKNLKVIDQLDEKILSLLNEGLMMRIVHPIIIDTLEGFTKQQGESEKEEFNRIYEQNFQLYTRLNGAVEKNIAFISDSLEYLKEKL